ncbi:hypothetical protein ACROYT_G043011 [Oculina patagonica]
MYECQGQHKCTLYAENTAFGDPCDGVTKNLAVDYSCVSTPPFQGFLVRACEDEVLDISCPTNINIISANYGRTTGEQVCNGDDVSNTNCGAAESIAIVRSACQGKQECSLKASNDVFGDPCDGITKYLEIGSLTPVRCIIAREKSAVFTEGKIHVLTVSEGEEMSLDCGSNFIYILRAKYGFPEKQCFAGRSVEVAVYECQGQHRCTLYAENSAFGDPCDGVTKKLEVHYWCMSTLPSQGFLVRACEGEVLEISCPAIINIISANYGRTTGGHICSGGDVSNTNCGAAESIDIVRSACQSEQECSLKASGDVFRRDPCAGITKYLEG